MIHLDLFLAFLKIGLFTFGGGYAMLPMIQEEVAAHGWLNQSDRKHTGTVRSEYRNLYRRTDRRHIRQYMRYSRCCVAVICDYTDCCKVLCKIQKQQTGCWRDERLETGCGRLDSRGIAFAFANSILSGGIKCISFRHSAVLCIALYFCRSGCFGFQKAPPNPHNLTFSGYRGDNRICVANINSKCDEPC